MMPREFQDAASPNPPSIFGHSVYTIWGSSYGLLHHYTMLPVSDYQWFVETYLQTHNSEDQSFDTIGNSAEVTLPHKEQNFHEVLE